MRETKDKQSGFWVRVVAVFGGLLSALPLIAFVVTGISAGQPVPALLPPVSTARCPL